MEKITWQGRSLTLTHDEPPTKVVDARSAEVRLETLDVTDAAVRPTNQDAAEGTPLPVFQAPGVRVDVSKRYRAPMGFWHRNMEHDELIFCHQGGMVWETELGTVTLRAGQMLLIPQGVAHRALPLRPFDVGTVLETLPWLVPALGRLGGEALPAVRDVIWRFGGPGGLGLDVGVAELEVNPLIVGPQGAVAVDVRGRWETAGC